MVEIVEIERAAVDDEGAAGGEGARNASLQFAAEQDRAARPHVRPRENGRSGNLADLAGTCDGHREIVGAFSMVEDKRGVSRTQDDAARKQGSGSYCGIAFRRADVHNPGVAGMPGNVDL